MRHCFGVVRSAWCVAKSRKTCPKISSSMKIATVREKTIPAITAIAVIANCIAASQMRVCVRRLTVCGHLGQARLRIQNKHSRSQSHVIEILVFSAESMGDFVSAGTRCLTPDTGFWEVCAVN